MPSQKYNERVSEKSNQANRNINHNLYIEGNDKDRKKSQQIDVVSMCIMSQVHLPEHPSMFQVSALVFLGLQKN